MTICDAGECQQAPSAAAVSGTADANLVASVAGAGFLTPELALGLVAAAAIVPGSDVSTSEKEIGGVDSLCADVTGIKDPTGADEEMVQEFSVCVTEDGVLASFSGATNTGEQASIEMVAFSDTVDPAAFEPPAGAKRRRRHRDPVTLTGSVHQVPVPIAKRSPAPRTGRRSTKAPFVRAPCRRTG